MQLDVQVLGPLRVLIDGRAIELGPERRRTVLAALAVEPGRIVSLDALADRVWDGDPPPNATATVHAYISRLRTSMRTFDRTGTETPVPLLTRAPGYLLALPPDALDAQRFSSHLSQARAAYSTGDFATASRLARAGLGLWRDHPYLDVSAEFARHEATRLDDVRLDAQELAVRSDLALGLHEFVLAEIDALAADQPFREGLHAALLLALYRSGRQADALAHFSKLRDGLADELGLDPGPEIRRLHDQILRQDPELDLPPDRIRVATPGAAPTADSAVQSAGDSAVESVQTGGRIVGREAELARVDALLARVHEAALTPVAVVGEAGIGKTRLVEEVAARASRRGLRVAWGRCWQHEGAPLLWPWLQALESLVDQLPVTELESALEGPGGGIAALLPRLASAAPGDLTAPATRDAVRVRLYDAVLRFLTAAASTVPVVLVLEDMHWADAASRELAEYVVESRGPLALGLLVTVRSPTEDSARFGTELLTSWARSGRGERIDLVGLPPQAVADYVTDRTGSVLDRATSEALADRTGGNPFFVGELVRLLVTDVHENARGHALTQTVPDSIRDVIARRVERLPETDQSVLRVAAVLGRTFDLELLQSAVGLPEDVVDEAVDRATELGIISSEPDDVGRHRFVHALTQQTLLDTTGPARLRRYHERVAAALDVLLPDGELTPTDAERLSFHLARAGGRADLERAVDLCLTGSDQAVGAGNHPEAENLLLRALELSARLTGDSAGRREMAARVRLWSLYTSTGGPGTAEAVGQHQRALALIERFGGTREIMAGHQALLSQLVWAADMAGTEQLLDEMSTAAETAVDDLMRAAVHIGRGEVMVNRGRPQEALAEFSALERFIGILQDTPPGIFPIEPRVAALIWHSFALTLAEEHRQATAMAAAAERQLRDAPVTTVAYGQILLAMRAALVDDPVAAGRLAEAADELTARHTLVEASTFVAPLLAWSRERAAPGSALDAMAAALSRTTSMPTMGHRTGLWALLADVYLRAGLTDEALTAVRAGRDEAAVTGEHLFLPLLGRIEDAARRSRPTG